MSFRGLAVVLGFAWVVWANIATDERDKTQAMPVSPTAVAAPKAAEISINRAAETSTAPKSDRVLTLYVIGSVVNVRGGPSTAYEKLFQLRKGQTVKELETRDGWTKLSFNNRSGWMSEKYLSANKPAYMVAKLPTKRAPQCHPNYSGACVPITSDVDCAGGSGNGPAYVRGPVRVIGRDVYRLDGDKDGIGCE